MCVTGRESRCTSHSGKRKGSRDDDVGVRDATVVAHVVTRGEAAPEAEALQQFLADRLARYKIPREFVFAASLPRTPTGKLQKFLLRQERSAP